MNKALSNLLKENRKALQGLHAIADMDFEKPFTIIECNGNFTHNSILNALGKPDLNEVDVFVMYKSSRVWVVNYNYLTHVIKGKFESQRDEIEGFESAHGWRWFDTAIGKGTFEKIRKDKNGHYWIIAQERKYIIQRTPKAVDYSIRYRVKAECGNGMAIPYDYNSDWYYDNVIRRDVFGKYYPSPTPDKSGYFNTNNYKARVMELKAERSTAEAARFDNTEKLREFTERINHCNEALQIILAGKYIDVDYGKIADVIGCLRWIKSHYNALKDNNFNSVSSIEFTLERLEREISKAEKYLKGE